MKRSLAFFIVAVAAFACSNQKPSTSPTCYKGRLEVKGICSNYTIGLVKGRMDTAKLLSTWTDETTGKEYSNVFGLGNPCNFPSRLNAGDEFYFTLDTVRGACAVCMAYYPTPSRKLYVKVLDGPCN